MSPSAEGGGGSRSSHYVPPDPIVAPRVEVPAGAPYVAGAVFHDVPGAGAAPAPLPSLLSSHVDLADLFCFSPYVRTAMAPLDLHEMVKCTLMEGLECAAGWVRMVDPHSRKAPSRGSRDGTARDLSRVRVELAAAREDNLRLRDELFVMSEQLRQLSDQVTTQANVIAGGRIAGVTRPEPAKDMDRALRFRRSRGAPGQWDICREMPAWRRDNPGGDVGAGFVA